MDSNRSPIPSLVLDASTLILALIGLRPDAQAWLGQVTNSEARAAWPAHLYAEVAHVLVRLVRAGRADRVRALDAYADVGRIRARVGAPRAMEAAIGVAFERRLTVYDAAYVVLAEALHAPLVTADRKLAEATEQAVLLPG